MVRMSDAERNELWDRSSWLHPRTWCVGSVLSNEPENLFRFNRNIAPSKGCFAIAESIDDGRFVEWQLKRVASFASRSQLRWSHSMATSIFTRLLATQEGARA